MNDKLLTKYQVMEYLSIGRRKFEDLVSNDGLPCIRIGKYKRYVRSSDLDRWLGERFVT
jgi:excisionase family DNA binding protein